MDPNDFGQGATHYDDPDLEALNREFLGQGKGKLRQSMILPATEKYAWNFVSDFCLFCR